MPPPPLHTLALATDMLVLLSRPARRLATVAVMRRVLLVALLLVCAARSRLAHSLRRPIARWLVRLAFRCDAPVAATAAAAAARASRAERAAAAAAAAAAADLLIATTATNHADAAAAPRCPNGGLLSPASSHVDAALSPSSSTSPSASPSSRRRGLGAAASAAVDAAADAAASSDPSAAAATTTPSRRRTARTLLSDPALRLYTTPYGTPPDLAAAVAEGLRIVRQLRAVDAAQWSEVGVDQGVAIRTLDPATVGAALQGVCARPPGADMSGIRGHYRLRGWGFREIMAVVRNMTARQTWDPRFSDGTVLRYATPTDQLVHTVQQGNFLVSSREFLTVSTVRFLPPKLTARVARACASSPDPRYTAQRVAPEALLVSTSLDHALDPGVGPKRVRGWLHCSAFGFNDIAAPPTTSPHAALANAATAAATDIDYLIQVDPCGSVPGSLMVQAQKQTPLHLVHIERYLRDVGGIPFVLGCDADWHVAPRAPWDPKSAAPVWQLRATTRTEHALWRRQALARAPLAAAAAAGEPATDSDSDAEGVDLDAQAAFLANTLLLALPRAVFPHSAAVTYAATAHGGDDDGETDADAPPDPSAAAATADGAASSASASAPAMAAPEIRWMGVDELPASLRRGFSTHTAGLVAVQYARTGGTALPRHVTLDIAPAAAWAVHHRAGAA
ncbi:hypothetical protein CXG81DRAFT_27997 [Caulochytrium protostelioides]|uniref:START domain-containing protein n=1 Tax=Caulochytrium protostelioides TaxID=1555241 RepID=A0A4P9X0G4_9FUNG|nr:hypothetical protein CXG81DRAFT_27997 [Caulochytrium protostelioides]|eukprot:RKO99231.1 hypothetical protein CXG81DRAFT_27997 [Caulochytrium protostelioides]